MTKFQRGDRVCFDNGDSLWYVHRAFLQLLYVGNGRNPQASTITFAASPERFSKVGSVIFDNDRAETWEIWDYEPN